MVGIGLGHVRLEGLQESLGTGADIFRCSSGNRRLCSDGGFRSIVCGKLRSEVGGECGCFGSRRQAIGLDSTDVCVLGLFVGLLSIFHSGFRSEQCTHLWGCLVTLELLQVEILNKVYRFTQR